MNIGINGLGRIGKQFLIAALESGKNYNFFVNTPEETDFLAYSLKHDSVHPSLNNVRFDKNNLFIGNKKIPVTHQLDPTKIPWKKDKVEIVVECSGHFTHKKDAEGHIKAGAKKVLISAPGKNADATIIYKVNDSALKGKVVSAGSCTTNAAAPLIKILHDKFGIENAYFFTTHAYTATQNLIDGHNRKSLVRGRAAAQNIVPTSSGAAIAVTESIPDLKGKVDGYALRVPVVDGSFVTVAAKVKKKTKVKEINSVFKKLASGTWKGVLEYSDELLVSTDIINNSHSCIFDSNFTKVQGDLVSVAAWYDNEFGYSHRLVNVLEMMTKK